MRTELLFCGFGGQGIIFAGKIMGQAGVAAKLETAQSASYGSEARGSACHAGVVVSTEQIGYPKVTKPDILVAMSQEAYDKFINTVKSGGTVFYDSHLVNATETEGVVQNAIPATSLATDIGRRGVANVVMLSAMVASSGIVSKDNLQDTLDEQSPPAFKEINGNAVDAGFGFKG
ncbi:MAG: 2-oxoacid:ferredoxin oxidoreductase subunit gamma [Calditrichaeota bacterium]|jgi:2-oxoglutarate ferredoxin oxidoreductase subunit gamma|nr:2-oxoacid:ferredoxin oxidoreductase subunit gamma [Calditrichota bacterium]MBT7789534.1 2-oxoacid:ferredoxin oxidoreductase subunit gamma [Calditrichota bacterium]